MFLTVMRVGFGSHKLSLSSLSKNGGHGEKMLEKDLERENKRRGEVLPVLVGFIILPLFLGCPFALRC